MKDQEEEVSRLLASLKTVEAPEDFEGGVRTRIAMTRDEGHPSRPTILLVAKFALPLVVLLVLGGFFIISDDGTVNVNMVPPILDHRQDLAVMEEASRAVGAVVETNGATVPLKSTPANRSEELAARSHQGGSQDLGLSPDDSAVFPAGVDPRKARISNLASPPSGPITPISLLSFIGITSGCSPVSCTVRTVREDSPAERAGVRAGDIIETIGDRPIDSFGHSMIKADKLGVIRDGKRITISLVFR